MAVAKRKIAGKREPKDPQGNSRTKTIRPVRGEGDPSDGERRFISFQIGDKVYSECIDGDITLAELTPDELMNGLNRAVGQYAMYGEVRANAKRMQAKISSEYEAWKVIVMNRIMQKPDFKKATNKALEVQVMIENAEMYKDWERRVRDINMICDKLLVLMNAFEMMQKTLQSCLAWQRSQLESAGRQGFAVGHGDMASEG
jgi:hypothetical protein